jgi:hypothetical protein
MAGHWVECNTEGLHDGMHIVAYNNNYGIGDKEESFIEQGHQRGIKENPRFQGRTNFQKKKEASLKSTNNCYTSINN